MNVMTSLNKMMLIGLLLFAVTDVAQAQTDMEAGRAEARESIVRPSQCRCHRVVVR